MSGSYIFYLVQPSSSSRSPLLLLKWQLLAIVLLVVPRSELRSPEGYSLPATVMAKPGAFLLVPQKLDWSGLFVGSQRRFAELDAAGWDALRKDDHKLHAVLLALGARGDGGELRWLYDPGLAQEAEKRVRELQLSADA